MKLKERDSSASNIMGPERYVRSLGSERAAITLRTAWGHGSQATVPAASTGIREFPLQDTAGFCSSTMPRSRKRGSKVRPRYTAVETIAEDRGSTTAAENSTARDTSRQQFVSSIVRIISHFNPVPKRLS